MANENMQKHFNFLELHQVWKSIGFSLNDKVLKQWRRDYPVNIAMLDSDVEETHEAFKNNQDPTKVKYSQSFVTSDSHVGDGHGTFSAGVAAGYPIKSPENVTESTTILATKRLCRLMSVDDENVNTVKDLVRQISDIPLEIIPYIVGVAPFANIFSYKIKNEDFEEGLEDRVASALESIRDTNRKESALENKVHIVCIAQALHYNGRMRQAIYDVLNENVIIVAAACNKGQTYDYCNSNIYFPARFGNVITVGSHDIHGQPSKFSSVGREVDFLAYGEQIWGPSIKRYENAVETDDGTSVSAAIVCGIVALVLAFVQKEKSPAVRLEISNNPVMREILGKIATKSGQHDEVKGYGCLKPLHVFRHNAYALWSLIDRVSDNYSLAAAASAKVSKPFDSVNGNLHEVSEGIGHASDVECVDEILKKLLNDKSTQRFCTAKKWHSFPVNDTSLPKSESNVQHKVTVAILGDAINIHHNEIKGKINVDSHFKCFIDPAEGAVEKDRHLGTVCASIIAGNSKGIAPFVDLVYATVINRNKQTKPEWVIAALEWIDGLAREREHIKVDIVVIPLGFEKFHLGLFQAINRLSAGNTIVVCAASRTHEGVRPKICYPAKYGDVICVGSHSSSSQPSSFSPQGREIDLLALGEDIGFRCCSVLNDSSETITEKYTLSGTCIAVACAAGIIAQMMLFSLQCDHEVEHHEITNNTVVRELLRNVTCNFSHSPQSGHGWLTNLFESELFKDSSYFTMVLREILNMPDPTLLSDAVAQPAM